MKRRGSVVIIAVLVVAFALIGIAAILTTTYLNGYQYEKTEFRGTVTQIVSSSRGAVIMALADISKQLDFNATHFYQSPYYDPSKIIITNATKKEGYTILNAYQNKTRISYPGTGLLINFNTTFACNWTDTKTRTGYSLSRSNITIDIPNMGFSGLENHVQVETNATLKNLIDTDGRIFSFTMTLLSEGDKPIDNLNKNLLSVYYSNYTTTTGDYFTFTEYTVNSLQFTNGTYLVTCGSEFDTIDTNIANLTIMIDDIPIDNFTAPSEKELIQNKLDMIESKYNSYHSGNRSEPWLNDAWVLLYEVRTKMDHSSSGCVVTSSTNTTDIVFLIDLTLSQLRPTVRIVVTDFRGITVSAFGECGNETVNPMVIYEKVTGSSSYTLTATADNHLSDNDDIVSAEYYISNSSSSIPGGAVARSMFAADGVFDESIEQLTAPISSSYLYAGANYLWIRVEDSRGHWSDYVKVKIPGYLYLDSIDIVGNLHITLTGYSSGSGSGAKYWVIATVRIVDEDGAPISGAIVKGTWSGSYSTTSTGTTSVNGYCTFETPHRKYSDWSSFGGYKVFTIKIGSVTKSGYSWIEPTPSDTIRLSSGKIWVY